MGGAAPPPRSRRASEHCLWVRTNGRPPHIASESSGLPLRSRVSEEHHYPWCLRAIELLGTYGLHTASLKRVKHTGILPVDQIRVNNALHASRCRIIPVTHTSSKTRSLHVCYTSNVPSRASHSRRPFSSRKISPAHGIIHLSRTYTYCAWSIHPGCRRSRSRSCSRAPRLWCCLLSTFMEAGAGQTWVCRLQDLDSVKENRTIGRA